MILKFKFWISAILISFTFFSCENNKVRVLVFSKTAGFRHNSITAGKLALLKIGEEQNIKVDTSENAEIFTDDKLKKYNAIVFLSTTGDILNQNQQVAFERFIQAGGGFVGIHAASDTEYDWPWYVQLIGGNFESHPHPQDANLLILDNKHPSTLHLPKVWTRKDEWYNFKNINKSVKVIMTIDEKSYEGGKNGDFHPMSWYHNFDGGRVFYTALGHTDESYSEQNFLKHLTGGLQYAVGDGNKPDYSNAISQYRPELNRFSKQTIKEGIEEPMALAISKSGMVFYCQRNGKVVMHEPIKNSFVTIANIDVNDYAGNGLLGMALDPDFDLNSKIYFFFIDDEINYRLSRFKLKGKELDLSSEEKIISLKFDYEPSAHTGGSILFDKDENILLSVGDNTPPWQANGYPPMDERDGREIYDAQRTAPNSNDYRGKILRIKPNKSNAGYTIPEGNLFKNPKDGLPEIYIMGCRNPWRMSYDYKKELLYWGEVGPDAKSDSTIGPKGYDEINQARKAGNFGWPYFIADNKPYTLVNLVKPNSSDFFDVKNLFNNSKNNTGTKKLPEPQKAFIWYPYDYSNEFPQVGVGGRTACAGPIYHSENHKNSLVKFPPYYDGKLFIYEWMRDWVMVVTTEENGDFRSIEPFCENLKFDHPTAMAFAPDGSLYVLEYGFVWYSSDKFAKLSRITFNPTNRAPEPVIACNDSIGSIPLVLNFNALNSKDIEGHKLIFDWSSGDFQDAKGDSVTFTYTTPGVYFAKLTAIDELGARSQVFKKIIVGNTYPDVSIEFNTGNKTFYFPEHDLEYNVKVSDKEDKNIDPKEIKVVLSYLNVGKDIYPLPQQGHTESRTERLITENPVIAKSDCKGCHTFKRKSVGPAFLEISKRYANQKDAKAFLAKKIINGGSGNWGNHAMSAHPQITLNVANEMVDYILSLNDEESGRFDREIPYSGTIDASEFKNKKGTFYISAFYQDKGNNGTGLLSGTDVVKLINNKVEALDCGSKSGAMKIISSAEGFLNEYLGAMSDKSNFIFNDIDITAISSVEARYSSKSFKGKVEIRLDDLDGELIGVLNIKPLGEWEKWTTEKATIKKIEGKHNLVFKIVDGDIPSKGEMLNIDWLVFKKNNNKTSIN